MINSIKWHLNRRYNAADKKFNSQENLHLNLRPRAPGRSRAAANGRDATPCYSGRVKYRELSLNPALEQTNKQTIPKNRTEIERSTFTPTLRVNEAQASSESGAWRPEGAEPKLALVRFSYQMSEADGGSTRAVC